MCLAWVRMPMVGDDDRLRSGEVLLGMWPTADKDNRHGHEHEQLPFRAMGSTVDCNVKSRDEDSCQLHLQLDEHPFEVVAPRNTTVLSHAEKRFSGHAGAHPGGQVCAQAHRRAWPRAWE